MKYMTLKEAFSLMRGALYEIKDAPLSKEEMVQKAEKTLEKLNNYLDPKENN